MNSDQPGRDADPDGQERKEGAAAARLMTEDEYGRAEQCGDGVEVGAQDVRNLAQQQIADRGMSEQRAARIANSPDASKHGGKKSGAGGSSKRGRTPAQKKAAGREGGKAAAKSS
jgi:hypothetical protein